MRSAIRYLICLAGCTVAGVVAAAQSSEPVQAIWKPQEFTFHYQSFTTFYSCDSLESKLEQILKQVGAEAVVKVRSPDCGRGPVRQPSADIQLISPVEATPDALAELKRGDTRRELAARVAGKTKELEEMEKPFAAQWQRVTVGRSRKAAGLENGDCELLDQVRKKILPKLAVRVVKENSPCPPNSPSLTRPTLIVDALTQMPKPDDAMKETQTP